MKKRLFRFACGIVLSSVVLLPIWLLLIQSIIPATNANLVIMCKEPVYLFSSNPTLEQFSTLFSRHPGISNTLIRDFLWSLMSAVVQCLVSVICGFLLAKYRGVFTGSITAFFLLTMIIPLQMHLVPICRIIKQAGLDEQPVVMYLTIAFSPLGSLYMRQVFVRLQNEYIESFRLESDRIARLFSYVVFPAAFRAGCVLFLFSFTEAWSMVEQPLFLIYDSRRYPLSLLLYNMHTKESGVVFATSLLALSPIILLTGIIILIAVLRRKRSFVFHMPEDRVE